METALRLNDKEIAALDGHCRIEIQDVVTRAKHRLAIAAQVNDAPANIADFVALVVTYAQENGRLGHQVRGLSSCPVCNKRAGHAKHTRSGRNHKKGDTDYNKPLKLWGVDLAVSFVKVDGHTSLGACMDCIALARPYLKSLLADVPAEIAQNLFDEPPRFKWRNKRQCTACDWLGHEGQMKMLPAIFEGTYPGECPSCGARNDGFGRQTIKVVDGWELEPVP